VAGFNAGGVSGSRQSLRTAAEAVTFKRNGGLNLGDITKDAAWLYRYISNIDDLKGFLAGARDYPEGWLVEMLDNIYMMNDGIPEIEVGEEEPGLTAAAPFYKGDFDGCGYSIDAWASDGVAMFGELYGTIKNLTIGSGCAFSNPKPDYFGFVVRDLKGTMENCTNNASLDFSYNDGSHHVLGLLVGRSSAKDALIKDCVNNGNITISSTLDPTVFEGEGDNPYKSKTQYIGGIVGNIGVESDELRMTNCENNGSIKMTVDNGGNGSTANFASVYLGGLVGATSVHNGSAEVQSGFTTCYGMISECQNSGDISAEFNGGTGGYFRLGGIIGYCEGALSYCENTGAISYTNSYDYQNACPALGGIAGVVAGTAPVVASNCTNKGPISLSGTFGNGGNAYNSGCAGTHRTVAGGCFGNVGDNAVLIENCDNYGSLTIDCTMPVGNQSGSDYGGITGYDYATVRDCHNYGAINAKSTCHTVNVAGIVGYARNAPVESCVNEGEIVAEIDVQNNTNRTGATGNVAGIVGYPGPDNAGTVKDCINQANISVPVYNTQLRLGGIIGIAYCSVDGCSNFGNISGTSLDVEGFKMASYAGGIVAYQNLKDSKISNCTNKGSIDLDCGDVSDTSYGGGLVGCFKKTFIDMENCYNSGDVRVVDGASMDQVGGAIGRIESNSIVTNVTNDGKVTFEGGVVCRMAGICGYVNKVILVTFKDCVNNGDVIFKDLKPWASSYCYMGGIAGYYGTPQADGVATYDGCINNGAVKCEIEDLAWCSRMGGIASYGGGSNAHKDIFLNCENHGDISSPGTTASKVVAGGIIAYGESQSAITCDGCINDGKMEVGGKGLVGGILGASAGNTSSTFTNFAVKAGTELTCAEGGAAGLIVGSAQKYTTPMTGTVAGKVNIGENSVTISAENYQDYLFGKGNGGVTDVTGVTYAE
ncbi:MAG: hypothetical protein J6W82_02285, partial [Bacteroidales bacterium]|nr:hypothetical protein [Bacteroidales bacterium]